MALIFGTAMMDGVNRLMAAPAPQAFARFKSPISRSASAATDISISLTSNGLSGRPESPWRAR